MKILINASNLHNGGAVQVASSFIYELANIVYETPYNFDVSVVSSSSVDSNLPPTTKFSSFKNYNIINVYGVKKVNKLDKLFFSGYDLIFTVFGPFYLMVNTKSHICGFAQPWIAYPSNHAFMKLPLLSKLKSRIKYTIQSFVFKKYDRLIVEQVHVKEALVQIGYNKDKISVVSNCVSSIYETPSVWKLLPNLNSSDAKILSIGFIGRAYKHKNVEILKDVNNILRKKYKFECRFLFTFTGDEMSACGFSKLENFISVGEIKVEQCPSFYQQLDALVFPSLLECFSASPIEAMRMGVPVFASDYPFISEVCGDAAYYFNPVDANSIALSIFEGFSDPQRMQEKKLLGFDIVKALPVAKDRAIGYLDIINDAISIR